jgi:amidase
MPLAKTLDTVGWFARDPATYERVGEVLLGDDVAGPALGRLVIADDLWGLLGQNEAAALAPALTALESQFAAVEHTNIVNDGMDLWRQAYRTLQGFEAWSYHGAWIDSHDQVLSEAVRERFEASRMVTKPDYQQALVTRRSARARIDEVLGDDGVIALPTVPTIAPLREADTASLEEFRSGALTLTCAAGLSECPQISLPLATMDGAPLGLSLMAARGRDRALIGLARRILGK